VRPHPWEFEELRHGRTQVVLSVPTRKDRVGEQRDALTLELRLGKGRFEKTVFVRG
jgi:hypothetical protein